MGWITPITNWTPSPVGNADFNRIEGNIKYLREETATFNGAKTFTNNITQTAGVTSLKATTVDTILNIKKNGASTIVGSIGYATGSGGYIQLSTETGDINTELRGYQIGGVAGFFTAGSYLFGAFDDDGSSSRVQIAGNLSVTGSPLVRNNISTETAYGSYINNSSKSVDFGVGGSLFSLTSIANRGYWYSSNSNGLSIIGNNQDIRFYNSLTTESARMFSSGRWGIGGLTDNGVDKLQVNGSIYASGGIKIGSGGTLITKIEWVA